LFKTGGNPSLRLADSIQWLSDTAVSLWKDDRIEKNRQS